MAWNRLCRSASPRLKGGCTIRRTRQDLCARVLEPVAVRWWKTKGPMHPSPARGRSGSAPLQSRSEPAAMAAAVAGAGERCALSGVRLPGRAGRRSRRSDADIAAGHGRRRWHATRSCGAGEVVAALPHLHVRTLRFLGAAEAGRIDQCDHGRGRSCRHCSAEASGGEIGHQRCRRPMPSSCSLHSLPTVDPVAGLGQIPLR
jgi:hypothetical protein